MHASVNGGDRMNFGKKVKNLREKKKWSQYELALLSGIAQPTISRVERGEFKGMKNEGLMKLSKTLGVSVDYLVGRTKEMKPSDIIGADHLAKELFSYYSNFDQIGKQQILDFARFISKK